MQKEVCIEIILDKFFSKFEFCFVLHLRVTGDTCRQNSLISWCLDILSLSLYNVRQNFFVYNGMFSVCFTHFLPVFNCFLISLHFSCISICFVCASVYVWGCVWKWVGVWGCECVCVCQCVGMCECGGVYVHAIAFV